MGELNDWVNTFSFGRKKPTVKKAKTTEKPIIKNRFINQTKFSTQNYQLLENKN